MNMNGRKKRLIPLSRPQESRSYCNDSREQIMNNIGQQIKYKAQMKYLSWIQVDFILNYEQNSQIFNPGNNKRKPSLC